MKKQHRNAQPIPSHPIPAQRVWMHQLPDSCRWLASVTLNNPTKKSALHAPACFQITWHYHHVTTIIITTRQWIPFGAGGKSLAGDGEFDARLGAVGRGRRLDGGGGGRADRRRAGALQLLRLDMTYTTGWWWRRRAGHHIHHYSRPTTALTARSSIRSAGRSSL